MDVVSVRTEVHSLERSLSFQKQYLGPFSRLPLD